MDENSDILDASVLCSAPITCDAIIAADLSESTKTCENICYSRNLQQNYEASLDSSTGKLHGIKSDEAKIINENHVNEKQLTDISTINGFIKFNHGDNGISKTLNNPLPENCEDISKDPKLDELTESSYSGSTVATEESMVSSFCDDKACDSLETDSVDCNNSLSNSHLCKDLANLHLNSISDSQTDVRHRIKYTVYESEEQMKDIMQLITKDLSEPYSIYTYRYFIHNWPKLCFLAMDETECIGAIVCKLDMHKKMVRRGYIAMLAVQSNYRRCKIGTNLVMKAIEAMVADDCEEVVLETEITNKAALRLYENLGFVRDKRLFHYYLNGVDALRLKLWLS